MKADNTRLKHELDIALVIQKGIKAGVSMSAILDKISVMPGGPRTRDSMYRIYRYDIVNARADRDEELGEVAMRLAKAGDTKMLELALRSKAGWSPTQTVVEKDSDDVDENTSAIDDLLALLKQKKKAKEETQEDQDEDE